MELSLRWNPFKRTPLPSSPPGPVAREQSLAARAASTPSGLQRRATNKPRANRSRLDFLPGELLDGISHILVSEASSNVSVVDVWALMNTADGFARESQPSLRGHHLNGAGMKPLRADADPKWRRSADNAALKELRKRCEEAEDFVRKVERPYVPEFVIACRLIPWVGTGQRMRLASMAFTGAKGDHQRDGLTEICRLGSILDSSTVQSLLRCTNSEKNVATRHAATAGFMAAGMELPERWVTERLQELIKEQVHSHRNDSGELRHFLPHFAYGWLGKLRPEETSLVGLPFSHGDKDDVVQVIEALGELSERQQAVVVSRTFALHDNDQRKGAAMGALAAQSARLAKEQCGHLADWLVQHPRILSLEDFSPPYSGGSLLDVSVEKALLESGLSTQRYDNKLVTIDFFARYCGAGHDIKQLLKAFFDVPEAVVDACAERWSEAAASLWDSMPPDKREVVKGIVSRAQLSAQIEIMKAFAARLPELESADRHWLSAYAESAIGKCKPADPLAMPLYRELMEHMHYLESSTAARLAAKIGEIPIHHWAANRLAASIRSLALRLPPNRR